MTIQVQITGDQEYGRYIKALFVGDPGSGKTLISSTFPNPIFASAEGGLMSVARRRLPYVKIDASEKLLHLKKALEQEPEIRAKLLGVDKRGWDRIDTVVIDTIDEIARVLVNERLAAQKKDTLAIQDWGWLGDQLRGIIRSFRNLDMHVVFTCHMKQSEDSETGRLFFKPAIQGAVGDEIAGYVDLALLLRANQVARVVDGESKRVIVRYLRTMPDPSYPWIKDRSGMLPSEFEINFKDDFARINDMIFGGLDGEPLPVSTEVESLEVDEPELIPEPSLDLEPEPPKEVVPDPEPVPSAEEAQVDVPTGVDPETGEVRITVDEVRALSTKEKMKISAPFPCEECESYFDSEDQRDLSVIKKRRVLCPPCYRAA
jgi:hypothetical protein